MKFLELKDIQVELKEYLSDQMLDDDYSLLNDIEASAIEKVKGYTRHIINIDYELSRIGEDRNSDLKRTLLVLLTYDVESRLTVSDVRENTLRRYTDIMDYLKNIQKRLVTPTWLLRDTVDSESTYSRFDSYSQQNIICY